MFWLYAAGEAAASSLWAAVCTNCTMLSMVLRSCTRLSTSESCIREVGAVTTGCAAVTVPVNSAWIWWAGASEQDVHLGGQGLEQTLLYDAQNQLRRILPGGEIRQLKVEVTLLGVGGLHGFELFQVQLEVVHLLQAGGGGSTPSRVASWSWEM